MNLKIVFSNVCIFCEESILKKLQFFKFESALYFSHYLIVTQLFLTRNDFVDFFK